MKKEVINFEGVSFRYGHTLILHDVNLKIYEGDFITVVGPNGSGKTTLIKLILGILKPTSGRVLVYGRSPNENRNVFGYVPQMEHLDVHFPITVEEMILGGSVRPFGLIPKGVKKRIQELLEELEIAHLRNKHFFSLSGGQQQRVLLARALLSSPSVLVLDEPSSNIDVEGEEIITNMLKKMKGQKTIIVVTHDTGFVNSLTDRTLCMNNGRVVEHNMEPDKVLAILCGYKEDSPKVIHKTSR